MSSRRDLLFAACRDGNINELRRAIQPDIADGLDIRRIVDLDHYNSTPLHYACEYGHLNLAKYLIEKQKCDLNCTDQVGSSPLHDACRNGHLHIVKYFFEDLNFDASMCTDNVGSTPLHDSCRSGCLNIVQFLMIGKHCDIKSTNHYGRTAVHYAAREGHLDILKFIINGHYCDVEVKDKKGRTLLHYAVRKGHLKIVQFLINGDHCNTEACDHIGWTALHYAIWYATADQVAIVTCLLARCNPNCVTKDGKTPLGMTTKSDLIRLLLSKGANPTSLYPSKLQNNLANMIVKIFVLGDPGGGKSTLIKAILTEGGFFSQIFQRYVKVKDVDEKTAGVIPYDAETESMGEVTVYDFAGQKEYHAGHDAVLYNSMADSPSVITLVVDMRRDEETIKKSVLYWFSFIQNIKNRCKGSRKPHMLIIGSHSDKVSSVEESKKSQVIIAVVSNYNFKEIEYQQQINTDCRYAHSSSIYHLRSLLKRSCNELRDLEKIAAEHHSFLIFLLDNFKDRLGVALSTVEMELRHSFDRILSTGDLYLESVRFSDPFEMCEKLNERGNILFMKNQMHKQNSWIVIDKSFLLSKVNGVIFAPEGFKEYRNLPTNTGVIPLSKLVSLFPDLDSDMITTFLCHLEFCQEIVDSDLLSALLAHTESPLASDERFFFFPGLICLDRPSLDLLLPVSSNFGYSGGWELQCSKFDQFFSTRFLQVLLLRLAFYFTHAPTDRSISDNLVIQRRCKIWKTGIHWANRSGGEAIVDVVDLKRVVVIVCSKKEKMELVGLRSAIIHKVISISKEFCSNISVKESLIPPKDAYTYLLDHHQSTTVSINEVAETIKSGKKYVLNDNDQAIELDHLLYFEPFANLGEQNLKMLFHSQCSEEINDEVLLDITEHAKKYVNEYCIIFAPSQVADECTLQGSVEELIKVLEMWKMQEGTRTQFKQKLHQFSIFAGRNPLDYTSGKYSPEKSPGIGAHVLHHKPLLVARSSQEPERLKSGITDDDFDNEEHRPVVLHKESLPKLHELQLLEGTNIRIIERVAPDWKKLAIALQFDHSRIKTIEKDYRDNVEACQEMFIRWLSGEHDLKEPKWNTLVWCLKRGGFIDVAKSVEKTFDK